jgi:fructose PTS system EIIBC or EIIC component
LVGISSIAENLKKVRQYLLTGVSYAIPFVACGGIMIAFAIAFAPMTPTGPDFSKAPTLKLILDIGVAAFSLLLPVLAGYISFGIAGRPGLVPGFVGGFLAAHIPLPVLGDPAYALFQAAKFPPDVKEASAGFLGALIIGLLAGWVVNLIKKIPVSKYLKPIMPILVIPIISSLVIGVLMLKVIGIPIALLMVNLTAWLQTMGTGNAVVLALILGAMIAFDMGGPVNKVAFFFGAAMIKEGNYAVMGACAAAICTPPLGMGLATFIQKKLWSEEEHEAGLASLAMGLIGITEGAIPFAAADPLKVIPSIMVGSMVASTIAMLGHVGDHAPHGGPIVIPVVDHKLIYIVAIIAGMLVTALMINALKLIGSRKAVNADAPPDSAVSAS